VTATKLLLVGIDGLRVDDALRPGAAPHLAELVAGGAIASVRMPVPTISGPGWSTLLTGARPEAHLVVDNTFHGHRLFEKPDLLSQASFDDPTCTTFAAAGWPPLVDPAGPGPVLRSRPDQQATGQHRVVVRDGEVYGYRYADGEIAAWARLALGGGPDVSFVYLGEVDEAAHLHGALSAECAAAVTRVDAHLGSVVARVRQRADLTGESWLVAVTTDHGHLDEGGHGGGEDVVTRSFLAVRRIVPAGEPAPDPVALGDHVEPHRVRDLLLGLVGRGPAEVHAVGGATGGR
jgi:predicted AlkP superfamily pyrophosphatase or phosphodiesterase